ncbi:MAG: DNA polymerase IV [Paenibacillaceae bacterium]|nr:DNA polymerase IV [Paenibacillaceae bacterium]
MKRIVCMVDMQSFYASVEKALHPQWARKAVVVAGDPRVRSGVVLAACPRAKKCGVHNAQTLGDALARCPDAVVVRPHMQTYVEVAMVITRILERYTDAVEPFSIDEQFCDLTHTIHLHGDIMDVVRRIQQDIAAQTGVFARIGIGENKMLAKMACDQFAKRNAGGVYTITAEDVPTVMWPLPIKTLFGVGTRIEQKMHRLGIVSIGQLALSDPAMLERAMGINGIVLWRAANGIDDAPVDAHTLEGMPKSIGHGITLARDYVQRTDIETVLLELTDEVAMRCRAHGVCGAIVAVSCASGDGRTAVSRERTMPVHTHATHVVYTYVRVLFSEMWRGWAVRRLSVSVHRLRSDHIRQQTFDDIGDRHIDRVTDAIRARFGRSAIVYASSIRPAGVAYRRAKKIGGHDA